MLLANGWRWSASVVVLTLVLAVSWFAFLVWKEDDCACGLPGHNPWSIYNPFRAREPERLVRRYVESLQNGSCRSLPVSGFDTSKTQADLCGMRYSLHSATLRRIDSGPVSRSYGYAAAWDQMRDESDPLWVTTVQNPDGHWVITNIDTWY